MAWKSQYLPIPCFPFDDDDDDDENVGKHQQKKIPAALSIKSTWGFFVYLFACVNVYVCSVDAFQNELMNGFDDIGQEKLFN
jgi:hypothetical protein